MIKITWYLSLYKTISDLEKQAREARPAQAITVYNSGEAARQRQFSTHKRRKKIMGNG